MLSKKIEFLTQIKTMLHNLEEMNNIQRLQTYLKKLNLDPSMIQNKHEIIKHKPFMMNKIKKGLLYYKHKNRNQYHFSDFMEIEEDMKVPSNIRPLSLWDIMNEKKTQIKNRGREIDIIRNHQRLKVTYVAKSLLSNTQRSVVYVFRIKPEHETRVKPNIKELVIKEDGSGNKNEYNVIKEMNKPGNNSCNVIPLRQIKNREPSTIFTYMMPRLHESFQNFLNDCNEHEFIINIERIIYYVKQQMNCLYKINNNFVYTDLKPANIGILYKTKRPQNDKESKIVTVIDMIKLIDLGSVFKDNENEYVGTVPCVENTGGYFKLESENEKMQCMHRLLILLLFVSFYELIRRNKFKHVMSELKKQNITFTHQEFNGLFPSEKKDPSFFKYIFPRLKHKLKILIDILEDKYGISLYHCKKLFDRNPFSKTR